MLPGQYVGPAEGFPVRLLDGVKLRIRWTVTESPPQGPMTMRAEFRISSRWNMADTTEHLQAAAKQIVNYFMDELHMKLPMKRRLAV